MVAIFQNDEKCLQGQCYVHVCEDHSLSPTWITGKDCSSLLPTKADVFVCEEFTGSSFGYLRSFDCISLIGPRCVLDCLAADILIPKSKFPLFTLAMRDLVITTTGFSEPEKTLLAEKIQYMGGIYCPEYRQSVTHVVANHLCRAKYEKAVENCIPVMREQWVEAVWQASKKRNVHANDEEFHQYKCPVFYKLVVTCSQIPRKQKDALKSNINKNGGEFCGELEAGRTNVLIVSKPYGDKFTHANIWKIPCVTPEWVTESISKGHALPLEKFALVRCDPKCSTPEHSTDTTGLPDISASIINVPTSHVNETVSLDCTKTPAKTPVKTPVGNTSMIAVNHLESPKKDKHLQLINKINVSDVKKAGVFLDGCNIYLSGFSPEYTEKIRKIINSGGATRFNEISDSVTHVIVGDFVQSDIRVLKSLGSRIHVVTVEWLIESIRLRSTAPEDKFSCLDDLPSPIEFQSPLSKKGLLALHSQNKKHVRSIDMGITFSIAGYTAVDTKEIERLISTAGGKVVARRFKGIPDYGVVPVQGAVLFHTTTEIVTHLWLDDCADEGMLLPLKYYHQPVNFDVEAKPLSGCVITTTSYSGAELRFITELLEGLGAVHQSMMARINRPADNLLATSHLICPIDTDLTTSRKYKAACKWGIPSVCHNWLLSCAKENKRINEQEYLVSPDSHDSSVVIARTPQGVKRKFAEDHTESKIEAPAISSTMCAPQSAFHQGTTASTTPVALKTPVSCATPDDVPYTTPRSPGDIPTPETPYGRVFVENPSPKTRKMWKKWIDRWPEEPEFKPPPPKERRKSTPMAELIHRCWQKFAHEPYMKSFHTNNQDGSQIEDLDDQAGPSGADCRSLNNSSVDPNQELHQILDSASKASKESDTDSLSTPRSHSARNIARAPESLDLCTDLVEWVDPVISNQQKPTPVFLLTSIDNREQCEEMIRSLGGIVCSPQISVSNSVSFEQNATHLLCQQPSRNEKVLTSIAAGKWVLEKLYLEDSKREGHFLNEEDYEWGNPKASYLQKLLKPGSLNEQLAKAVYRWRCKIQITGKKAFHGMKAIICSSKEKAELYKRIVIAGGGEVLNISPPFSEPGCATVCILELAKVQHRVDLQTLVDKKVPCVPPLYLNDYLISDPPPDVMDCLIPEYRALQ
ncbi:Uncharacterized protein GBIM_14988 [Gryllus bimaculatus]|nr:Uncharacterized protein GBIM_14988 [Gryllus bimaculatus]